MKGRAPVPQSKDSTQRCPAETELRRSRCSTCLPRRWGSVDGLEDKRALRLVCKRSCDFVDSRVVAVRDSDDDISRGLSEQYVSALVRAPWQLHTLDLSYTGDADDDDAVTLAAACWPALQKLHLRLTWLGSAGAAALAAAHWPALRELNLDQSILGADVGVGDAGAASLAAAHWPALELLRLSRNSLGNSGAASLAAAHWPALKELALGSNELGDAGAASLAAARWPALQYLSLQMRL